MSGVIPFDVEEICDNCGKVGAFDFMGDSFCPSCLKICESCQSLFVINLKEPKDWQRFCEDCEK